jgi:hypothetical protein
MLIPITGEEIDMSGLPVRSFVNKVRLDTVLNYFEIRGVGDLF